MDFPGFDWDGDGDVSFEESMATLGFAIGLRNMWEEEERERNHPQDDSEFYNLLRPQRREPASNRVPSAKQSIKHHHSGNYSSHRMSTKTLTWIVAIIWIIVAALTIFLLTQIELY